MFEKIKQFLIFTSQVPVILHIFTYVHHELQTGGAEGGMVLGGRGIQGVISPLWQLISPLNTHIVEHHTAHDDSHGIQEFYPHVNQEWKPLLENAYTIVSFDDSND